MNRIASFAILAAALAFGACGGSSKADDAKNQVCSARADISKQVDTLKGLTVSTATTSQIKDSLKAIQNDLGQIKAAQGDLKGQRKSQVQAANEAFTTQVKTITSELGKSLSGANAKTQLTTAFQDLAKSYQQTFAKVDCGS